MGRLGQEGAYMSVPFWDESESAWTRRSQMDPFATGSALTQRGGLPQPDLEVPGHPDCSLKAADMDQERTPRMSWAKSVSEKDNYSSVSAMQS